MSGSSAAFDLTQQRADDLRRGEIAACTPCKHARTDQLFRRRNALGVAFGERRQDLVQAGFVLLQQQLTDCLHPALNVAEHGVRPVHADLFCCEKRVQLQQPHCPCT